MANIDIQKVPTGADSIKLKASGSGTTADPYVVETSASAITGSLPAGENVIGKTAGSATIASGTPILTVGSGYVTGDYVGTSASPIIFSGVGRINGGTGFIHAKIVDFAKQAISTELWLFNATVTPPADSAAWSISDADALKTVSVVPFSTWYSSALNSFSEGTQAVWFKCAPSDNKLYGCLVTRGSPSYTSGDLTVVLNVVQD